MGIFTKLKDFVGLSEAQEYEYEYDETPPYVEPENSVSRPNTGVDSGQGSTADTDTNINANVSNTGYAPPRVNQDLFSEWEENPDPRNSRPQASNTFNAGVVLTPGGDDDSSGFNAPNTQSTNFGSTRQPFVSPFTANS